MQTNQNTIEGAALRTIIFFDLFDYPLTVWEVYKYLLDFKADYIAVDAVLLLLCESKKIEHERGYFFLPNRKNIIDERQKRYAFADRKMKKAQLAACIFGIIPWVRFIAVGNLIGSQNMRDNSDIDLLIVARKNRVWLTRFFCASIAAILRWRPREGNSKDKICLSFFISDNDLSLDRFRRREKDQIADHYFTFWLVGLVPVLDRDNLIKRIMIKNDWLAKEVPNYQSNVDSMLNFSKFVGWKIFDVCDNYFQKWQTNYFPQEIKQMMNQDTRVVVDKDTLKLHVNDRRQIYENNFKKICQQFVD